MKNLALNVIERNSEIVPFYFPSTNYAALHILIVAQHSWLKGNPFLMSLNVNVVTAAISICSNGSQT